MLSNIFSMVILEPRMDESTNEILAIRMSSNVISDRTRRVLFVTRHAPTPYGGGAQVYCHDLLSFLHTNGFDVRVLELDPWILARRFPHLSVWIPDTKLARECPGFFRVGSHYWSLKGVFSSLYRKFARILRVLPKPRELPDASWGNPLTLEESACIEEAAQSGDWAAVICNYVWLADAFSHFPKTTIRAILTHDVWHQHVMRTSDNSYLCALDRDKEISYLSEADLVVAINDRDAGEFRGMVEPAKVVVAPMSCTTYFSENAVVSGRLLFVGSGYPPNVQGLQWFLREVGPALERAKPGHFELHVVGAAGDSVSAVEGGIRLVRRGFVKSLHPEYHAAQTVIVPLLAGTGLKIKLVEALAYGKAIVSTPVGAQGVERFADRSLIVAQPNGEMALAILALDADSGRRKAIETEAREVAATEFSSQACYGNFVSRLKV